MIVAALNEAAQYLNRGHPLGHLHHHRRSSIAGQIYSESTFAIPNTATLCLIVFTREHGDERGGGAEGGWGWKRGLVGRCELGTLFLHPRHLLTSRIQEAFFGTFVYHFWRIFLMLRWLQKIGVNYMCFDFCVEGLKKGVVFIGKVVEYHFTFFFRADFRRTLISFIFSRISVLYFGTMQRKKIYLKTTFQFLSFFQ